MGRLVGGVKLRLFFDQSMRRHSRALLVWIFFFGPPATTAFAQPVTDTAPARNSAKLTTIVTEIPAGTLYLTAKTGFLCIVPLTSMTTTGNRVNLALTPYTAAFESELQNAGYRAVTDEDNLFHQDEESASDYQVAAVITDLHVNACVVTEPAFGFAIGDAQGDESMTINWQVYSPLKKQVVARVTTSGTSHLEKKVPNGVNSLNTEAFASNVRELAANPEFRTAMNAAKVAPNDLLRPAQTDPVLLSGSLRAGKRPIADAVGSVVTLLTGSGSGSGALVSDDGYIITDAHVVGDEKQIRARWSDGIETVAQVIRVAKDRDIALVKTNPRDRSPLAIKRGAVTPGARVYAVGSPKGKDFQGTVSSGVISATRIRDGLRYIQSDVTVSPGSSGGPLLDEDGSVIGFTDIGFDNNGPAGLNFFTPIGDAMDFLNLEQK